ncbi:MAG: hypothetical protein CSB55_08430 [Candidatus Cloacimonadota bacterium]|nr:MAG: hypothetical protein CSB55_08430 [Candidatus Cloacimonadota bacterium]
MQIFKDFVLIIGQFILIIKESGVAIQILSGTFLFLFLVLIIVSIRLRLRLKKSCEQSFIENSKLKKDNSLYRRKIRTLNFNYEELAGKLKKETVNNNDFSARMAAYFENLVGQVWVFNTEETLIYCSGFSCPRFSVIKEKAVGMSIDDLLVGKCSELADLIKNSLKTGAKIEKRTVTFLCGNEQYSLLVNINPFNINSNMREGVVAHVLDYSLIAEKVNIFESIMNNDSELIIIYRKDGILFANETFAKISEYSASELKMMRLEELFKADIIAEKNELSHNGNIKDIINDDSAENVEKINNGNSGENICDASKEDNSPDKSAYLFPDGYEYEKEVMLKRKYGINIPVKVISKKIFYKNQVTGMMVISKESITNMSASEESISDAVFRCLLDRIDEGILIINKENIITHVSDFFESLVSLKKAGIKGKNIFDLTDRINSLFSDPADSEKFIRYLKNKEDIFNYQFELSNEKIISGSLINVSYENRFSGVILIIKDITGNVKKVQQLQSSVQDAQELNESKSMFLANMSHEIRTPMNGIAGVANLMEKTDLTPQQQRYLNIIKASSDSLLDIINDILDFSKIESGYMKLENIKFNFYDIINGVTDILSVKTGSKDIELISKISPEVPKFIFGDPTRIRQILINLGNNALKFTEKGYIAFKVRTDRKNEDFISLKLEVEDTGIGIKPDKVDTIFSNFRQEDDHTSRKYGGTGLGLSISEKLVKMMGGSIWVESQVGVGSTFHFTLKLQNAETESSEKIRSVFQDRNFKILVATESKKSGEPICEMLDYYGFNTFSVDDPEKLEDMLLEEARNNSAFNIALTDTFEGKVKFDNLIQILRLYPELEELKIIPMVDLKSGISLDYLESLETDGFISKPFKASDILHAIANASDIKELAITDISFDDIKEDASFEIENLKILLAEDNQINQGIITEILTSCGHEVVCAENGKEVLEKINPDFDLVLMDIQMPVMNGLEATLKIRQVPEYDKIPVVALSADVFDEDKKKCSEAGMNGFLAKPIEIKQLSSVLAKVSNGEEISVQRERGEEIKMDINMEHIYNSLGDNHKIILKTFELIDQKLPVTMKEMRKAVADKNAGAVQMSAHSIKGFINYFDFTELKQLILNMEKAGRNSDIKKAKQIMIDLEPVVKEFAGALKMKISELTS